MYVSISGYTQVLDQTDSHLRLLSHVCAQTGDPNRPTDIHTHNTERKSHTHT